MGHDWGQLKLIIAAGSLAMALRKAQAQIEGSDFSLGRAESDPEYAAYISLNRIEQARRILKKCSEKRIKVVLPVDYILEDLTVSSTIPDGGAQLDIGPDSQTEITKAIRDYINERQGSDPPAVMFYNGVFGKFEEPNFEAGTKAFIPLLKELTDAGVLTFVGGGEGRAALEKYGSLKDVTHAFTCGGTVLKSLTNQHIGFVKAMYLQNVAAS